MSSSDNSEVYLNFVKNLAKAIVSLQAEENDLFEKYCKKSGDALADIFEETKQSKRKTTKYELGDDTCDYVFKKGKNPGSVCGKKAIKGTNKCSTHKDKGSDDTKTKKSSGSSRSTFTMDDDPNDLESSRKSSQEEKGKGSVRKSFFIDSGDEDENNNEKITTKKTQSKAQQIFSDDEENS